MIAQKFSKERYDDYHTIMKLLMIFIDSQMENNWFSPYKVTSVYQTFLSLDQDMNGRYCCCFILHD
jgi:hypothetical protein